MRESGDASLIEYIAMSLRNTLRQVHDNSSVSLQTKLRTLYGRIPARWKLGREFEAYCEELSRNESRTREELEAMQLAKLREMVEHCCRQVPFYRERFDRIGFRPAHLKTFADFRNIPPITRDDLKNHFDRLRARKASTYKPETCYSSGSTGEPVKMLLDRKAIALEKACVRRHWLRSGYRDGEPFVNMRGLRLATKPDQYWVVDKGENCLYVSSYHLTSNTVEAYVKALNDFEPRLINCYPSSGCLLARLIEDRGLKVHSPRSIVCASETLYPHQRALIESVFKSTVWDWYGLTELVGNASECERHDGYHVSTEQGRFEVLDEAGHSVQPGEVGQIVATGLHNFSMPLLRYRTGDLATFTDELCQCGRGSRLIKSIEGRAQDYIETPGGARLTAGALNVHDNTWDNVVQFQYVQRRPDIVVLRVLKAASFAEPDERRILKRMGARFGDEMRLQIEYVSEIPKTLRGKIPLIVRETE
jgi:phenylacetate-CoA ligase